MMNIKVTLTTLNQKGKEVELESHVFNSEDDLQTFLKQHEQNAKSRPEIHDMYLEYFMN